MIWLAWRQHRVSLLAGLGALVVLGAFLVVTGLGTRADFVRLGLDQCGVPTHMACAETSAQFLAQHTSYRFLAPLFLLLPSLVGVFWGAPLVARELEQGTHRLVWTQSISRTRWLLAKTAFLALAVVLAGGFVSWLVSWWISPIMDADPQWFDPGLFDLMGIVPIAYALAALAIGIAAGTLTRKVIPAIGLTLVLFLALRVGIGLGARPNFMEPIHATFAFPTTDQPTRTEPLIPEGWKLTLQTLDVDGRFIGDGVGIEPQGLQADCPEAELRPPSAVGSERAKVDSAARSSIDACAEKFGFHVVAVYQPQDRYWRFQLTEAAIYVVVSGLLLGGSTWWIRHRIT